MYSISHRSYQLNNCRHEHCVQLVLQESSLLFPGLIKLRELVRSPHNTDMEIHLRQADPASYRSILKEIKSKEIYSIVIDTKPDNMQHFLKGVRSKIASCFVSFVLLVYKCDFLNVGKFVIFLVFLVITFLLIEINKIVF